MKKIMLEKYGFRRCKEEDFTDDGNRFSCYYAGAFIRVTKCISDGYAYIAARANSIKDLPYEVYSKLPHYSAMNNLNGVEIEKLTEADLIQFYNDCISYQAEYAEALENLKYPTEAELQEKAEQIQAQYKKEFDAITEIIKKDPSVLARMYTKSEYRAKSFLRLYAGMEKAANETRDVSKLVGTGYSFSFLNQKIETSSGYDQCVEFLADLS